MKAKSLLTTAFLMFVVSAFAYTTSSETLLRSLIGEFIFFDSDHYTNSNIYSIDTIWMKPLSDKSKAKFGKHYIIHRNTKSIQEIRNKKFYVQKVEYRSSGTYYVDTYLDVFLINTENPYEYLVWEYHNTSNHSNVDNPNLTIYVDNKTQSNRLKWISQEFYLHTNKKFGSDDHRGYTKTRCIDYRFAYKGPYLTEYEEITCIDENHKTYTLNNKKELITPDSYEHFKFKTIAKLKAEGAYFYSLSKIEKPKNPAIRYGKFQEIETIDNVLKFIYEDNIMSIIWHGTNKEFIFSLKNKSDNSLKIIWDEASFINEKNEPSRIIHQGIKYINANDPQPPTIVPKGTVLNDLIAPVNRIHLGEYTKSWYQDDLIENSRRHNKQLGGKNVKILLPIEIKGVVNEYIFTFDLIWKYAHPELHEE